MNEWKMITNQDFVEKSFAGNIIKESVFSLKRAMVTAALKKRKFRKICILKRWNYETEFLWLLRYIGKRYIDLSKWMINSNINSHLRDLHDLHVTLVTRFNRVLIIRKFRQSLKIEHYPKCIAVLLYLYSVSRIHVKIYSEKTEIYIPTMCEYHFWLPYFP